MNESARTGGESRAQTSERMEKEITEAKAEEEPIATTSEPVQPVSPRKLPALVLGEAKVSTKEKRGRERTRS